VLVIDGAAGVHRERRAGYMLDLVEPLPVRNDRPGDDQATRREHDAGAAVLSLR
jgi:hypothetical protein